MQRWLAPRRVDGAVPPEFGVAWSERNPVGSVDPNNPTNLTLTSPPYLLLLWAAACAPDGDSAAPEVAPQPSAADSGAPLEVPPEAIPGTLSVSGELAPLVDDLAADIDSASVVHDRDPPAPQASLRDERRTVVALPATPRELDAHSALLLLGRTARAPTAAVARLRCRPSPWPRWICGRDISNTPAATYPPARSRPPG